MSRGIDLFGEYEPAQTRLYVALAAPGDTVVDVGANFGWYTVAFARLVGPSGRLIAFEPMPAFAEMAREAIALNGITDIVTLVESGLGTDAGEFVVYRFRDLPMGHASATDLGRSDAVAHTCKVQRLDDYLQGAQIDRVDVVKIDVEGFESDVLAGAQKLLTRADAPLVAFEVNPECLKHRGLPLNAAQSVLSAAGYTDFVTLLANGRTQAGFVPDDGASVDCIAARPARAEQLATAVLRASRKGSR
jgi:FkbM family methyltransferase